MSTLKKLLLASAIAALSASSFAMEAMDESALSDTVAQEGLDIFLGLNITGATLTYTDADGVTPATTPPYGASGDLKVNNLGIKGDVKITLDVGGNNAATPTTDAALFVGIEGTSALEIKMDSITVNKTGATDNFNVVTMPAGTAITIATGYKLNLELGKGPSGHLGVLTGNLGTVTLGTVKTGTSSTAQTVALVDGGSGTGAGTIGVSGLELSGLDLGNTAANNVSIDACNGTLGTGSSTCTAVATDVGLKIKVNGTALNAVGVTMNDIRLGSSTGAIVGKVAVTGLNLSGTTMRIVGH